MRRAYLAAGLAALAASAAFLVLPLRLSPAARTEEKTKESGKSPTARLLPVAQVVLFSSGVGYFQREGSIDGDQRVDLTFPTQDINDLIKSMTLRDLDGGHIDAVSYESNVPVERTLQSFAVNLTGNPTFSTLLNQARGEKVEVVLQQGATQPGTLTGPIVGVEHKKVQVGKDAVVDVECLTLWCADGLRSVKLSEVQRLRFLNAIMDSEFKKALETLALGHDMQKKAVSIHFAGEGKRRVKVGYVVENPIWKTSYRLVLDKPKDKAANEKQEKPYLQGWAVVENTTDEDWSGVRMALISGRPISFQMNLYDALFLKRPVVEPELFASLRPPTYSGGITFGAPPPGSGGGQGAASSAPTGLLADMDEEGRNKESKARGYRVPREFLKQEKARYADDLRRNLGENLALGKSVASAASASKLGDYFQYAIDHPVTLPRQKSALLPILGKDVEGERLSIYNEATHAKFPLLGLAFTNTTGMHLTQGPITVYEGGTYAGDARILDLQKGERRLLSYAIDLGTEVQAVPHPENGRLTAVKIVKGILHTTTKLKDSKTYTLVNRNDIDRTLLVEHPNRTDFHLTSKDKPWETAADFHRFKVKVPAGKTVPFTVSEERDFRSETVLTNSDDQSLRLIIQDRVTSPAVKEALAKAIVLRGKMAETQRELQQVERQLRVITEDQDRLRKNLHEMPKEAVAYKRYLKKFDDQETQIEQLQKQQKELQDTEHVRRKDYETYLANLSVE
jgi:hypothetical protein